MIYVYRGVSIYKISTIVDRIENYCSREGGVSIYKISTIVDNTMPALQKAAVLVYTKFLLL